MEPDPLGQSTHDQRDVRAGQGLPLSVHGARRRRLRAAGPALKLLLAAAAALVFAPVAAGATIVGTQRADILHGTPRPDRITARGGNDGVVAQGGGADRISCGPGRDVVTADPSDRVSADCEVVSRQLLRDPFRNTDSQPETEVEPDSFSFGSTVVATFQVGRIASGGADGTGFAVSTDAGRTWRSGVLPGLTQGGRFDRASDPVVAYDVQHGLWLIASLVLTPGVESGIAISSSPDGRTWSAPVLAAGPTPGDLAYDKEWLACDNGGVSPFRGNCYLSYSDIVMDRLATQTSSDGGRTWSARVSSPDNAGRAGIQGPFAPAPQPLVRPNGDVVVPILDGLEVAYVRSTDGGRTFSNEAPIARMSFQPPPFRAPPLPSAEIDGSGTIYLVWPDCSFHPGCAANDLVLSRSSDGVTWSAPVRIATDPVGSLVDHIVPGLGVDPASAGGTARLGLVYYTLSRARLGVGFVSSADGGTTWSRPQRLNAEPMQFSWLADAMGRFLGDYLSTSFAGGRAVPVFSLASQPSGGFLHQAIFASSLPVP